MRRLPHESQLRGFAQYGNGQITKVPDIPFVDVVFVPDQNLQGFPISSTGHTCRDFRDTTGKAWIEICNGLETALNPLGKPVSQFNQEIYIGGVLYGTPEKSVLVMHANSGITFDLDAIRKVQPDLEIAAFKTICGLGDIHDVPSNPNTLIDIHVLLDGKSYFYREQYGQGEGSIPIEIPIAKHQRFLTIAVTDGGNGNFVDWLLLAEPVLEMDHRENSLLF